MWYNSLMKKQTISLRKILLFVFASAWLVPIIFFSWFIFHDYQKAYLEKTDDLIRNSVEVSGALLAADIDGAISKMQKPSYEGEWESDYRRYKTGLKSRSEYLTTIRASLVSKYYMDNQVARYAFYLQGEELPCYYAGKNGYSSGDYMDKVQPVVRQVADKDSNYVEVHVVDNQLYLIRNLYTVKDYEKYGTLVLGLDVPTFLERLPLENMRDARVAFGEEDSFLLLADAGETNGDQEAVYAQLAQLAGRMDHVTQVVSFKGKTHVGYAYNYHCDNYRMLVSYTLLKEELNAGINRLNITLTIILCCMIPFVLFAGYLLTVHISQPMGKLMEGASRLKEGDFGYIVEEDCAKNVEFNSLVNAFNAMSVQVEYFFNTVYLEKIATKDAQLAALQAQINPHFLNNTLEMMNWQARMNGDIETSRMIEALGIVLDSSMNRDNDRTVRLKDELRCADAFLYIMSMRFGQRLKVEKVIDPSLHDLQVPQLILQPLLENAIKHGIEKIGSGTIWVNIYDQDREVRIDVINTSQKLGAQEFVRINNIIQGKHEIDRSEPGIHNSIGIYNVNRRIQLIYGENYGLKVFMEGENQFVSRITMPFPKELERGTKEEAGQI